MKKGLAIVFLFTICFCNAQQDIYQKVIQLIRQSNPDLLIESKLLLINFDRSSIQENKSLYSELEKTASVYESAKLKGGKTGVVCVTVVNDTQAEVALDKEGYTKLIKIKIADLSGVNSEGITNLAFNSKGELLFKNIETKDIYGSVNKLITR